MFGGSCGFRGCQNPHTDIGVHLGSVHGLDELPEAFFVAVHLPVSTNEKLPAHDCVFCGCLLGIKTVPTAHQGTLRLGKESGRESGSQSIYEHRRFDPSSLLAPLVYDDTPASASPHLRKEKSKCRAAFKCCV